jgi:hypothetical protein
MANVIAFAPTDGFPNFDDRSNAPGHPALRGV